MRPATIDSIIANIVRRESSKFTDDPTDPGGPTKFGITLGTLRSWRKKTSLTAADVKALERPEAEAIYKHRYILKPRFDKLSDENLARLLIDTGVLHGQAVAVRMLQRAVKAKPDARLGPKTLALVEPLRGTSLAYNAIIKQRVNREIEKVLADVKKKFGPNVRKKSKLKYLRGWVVGRTLKEFLR